MLQKRCTPKYGILSSTLLFFMIFLVHVSFSQSREKYAVFVPTEYISKDFLEQSYFLIYQTMGAILKNMV
ncbi:MAG: hypothetical protein R2779_04720 [Crocinitomicaceae bacterium]